MSEIYTSFQWTEDRQGFQIIIHDVDSTEIQSRFKLIVKSDSNDGIDMNG